jgi:hypothetical protein
LQLKTSQCLEFPSIPACIRCFKRRLNGLAAKMLLRRISRSVGQNVTSLCVTDPASPGLPLFVLSLMRGVSAKSAQSMCQTFAGLSLATLSFDDNTEKRMVKFHHLQLEYCRAQCSRARATSHISVRSLVPEHIWHMRINDGLVAKRVLPA